jgi:hypothetical protein
MACGNGDRVLVIDLVLWKSRNGFIDRGRKRWGASTRYCAGLATKQKVRILAAVDTPNDLMIKGCHVIPTAYWHWRCARLIDDVQFHRSRIALLKHDSIMLSKHSAVWALEWDRSISHHATCRCSHF